MPSGNPAQRQEKHPVAPVDGIGCPSRLHQAVADVIWQHLINRRGPDRPPGKVISEEAPHLLTVLYEPICPTAFTITGATIETIPGSTHIIKTLHYFRGRAFSRCYASFSVRQDDKTKTKERMVFSKDSLNFADT